MIDNMNEITSFSPFGGKLALEEVRGVITGQKEYENDVTSRNGSDRDMYVYAPVYGCPDAKLGQVVMVLRDSSNEQSAYHIMKAYDLDKLAKKSIFCCCSQIHLRASGIIRQDLTMRTTYLTLFAAAEPCNAFNEGYFDTYETFNLK